MTDDRMTEHDAYAILMGLPKEEQRARYVTQWLDRVRVALQESRDVRVTVETKFGSHIRVTFSWEGA